MPAPAVAATIASVGGGLFQASAERRAANKAVDATNAASANSIAEIRRQFDTVRSLLQPYVSAGTTALGSQLALLGLGGGMQGGTPLGITTIPGTASQPLTGNNLAFAQSLGINTAGLNGLGGSPAMYQTSDGRTFKTMDEATAWANANPTGGKYVSANQAQQAAINQIKTGSQFKELSRQQEEAILANASATGGLRGGNTQDALATSRVNMLQALIDRQLGNLGGLTSLGAGAATGLGSAAQNTGGQIAGIMGDNGMIAAKAAIARGGSASDAISGITGSVGDLLGKLKEGPAGQGIFGTKWKF